uniref:Uncharacterized protein n=1 Tax=Anguilla anguilla TaxID=7936 RepID=A0A0E9QGT7_ANGAN
MRGSAERQAGSHGNGLPAGHRAALVSPSTPAGMLLQRQR